ncbi:hypothetical protein NQD34_002156 [Periophthalmus magnuspinnatus]|nr:hypothetical protein NQD34_002156 [Periophthalmus magnuspinnatus]
MATNKPVGSKLGSAETDSAVKIVPTLCAAPVPVKVVPVPSLALKPPSSVPIQPSPTTAPVMVVAKMDTPGAQVTKSLTSGVQISPSPAPGRTLVITVPRTATASVTMAPRMAQTTTTQLPANFQIPPGMMLIRSESGQLILVSQQALAQAQQATRPSTGASTPRLLTPSPTPPMGKMNDKVTVIQMTAPPNFQTPPVQKTVKIVSVPPKPAKIQSLNQPRILTSIPEPKKEATPTFSQETLESVKKCKNFLVTLIKLASSDSRSANMAENIRGLVKSLLKGKLEADQFTEQLYHELKSTPQPCLVPFLKKSLPAVRILTPDPELFIQQAATKTSSSPKPTIDPAKQLMPPPRPGPLTSGWFSQSRNKIPPKPAGLQSARNFTGTLSMRQSYEQPCQMSKGTSGSYKEDDDINDVASMAGVNLREENAQILTTQVGAVVQSCQDQPFLAPNALLGRVLQMGQPLEVTEVSSEVVALVSHAAQEFLRTLLEKLSVMAQHRKNLIKDNSLHSEVNDVRSQLKFLEDMETLRKKRKDDEERERLLRLARSRAHMADPEMLLLKQRAKELQHLEQAALQHREANLAALAAIGPRKKRPLELDGQVCVLPRSGNPRVTRIILRDLLQCMEQDRFLRHSLTLYRAIQ